ncbi:ribonuclease J [Acetobacter peroxydans]|jgi:ribonuclease J|uniref:MBL fold hydrolase n=1 Tax=Acetobacter peroxydans TaxID=104098 RepID=A0A4Y3TVC5_9PROT|nr:ribonuclease J [Acetobacter peroxydans]MCI2008005.1 ribonuclease J [Acetobacter peroxydans]MCI2077448.1 ribonuclease J [Acetobacter peroxydans]NHO15663.1 MBL fold metallo-hydrolase [Acetobacter peroxydans]GBR32717.1 metal-dependent hydrolase [Acetobacter peroxydans NBRC 13755]GBR44774.1 metal-dependent hydrolase [Acetobacter peroxydans]
MTGQNGDLAFLPLGGTGEIGMNLNLYRLGDTWLAIDCGIGFSGNDTPEAEILVPDPAFIVERKNSLAGLVITHAHEDHIGAVAHMWPMLECPVYVTPFAAAVLRRKLAEARLNDVPIKVVMPGSRFNVGPFDIEFVPVTHSVPEAQSMVLRTPAGIVVHTGDWKFDPDPLVGPATDLDRLAEIGREGVLALVCDSTNVMKSGPSQSEAEVRRSMTELVAELKGRIAVTCFASNVARVETIAMAAQAAGRTVVLVGRSLRNLDTAARECGYLSGVLPFLSEQDVNDVPDDRLLMIITGSQGEPRSALSRISIDEHPNISLGEGDTVIYSSRMIPGNERAIMAVQDNLARRGVTVITDRERFVHVSGHATGGDVRKMYDLLRPQHVVPVHGEWRHLTAQAALAQEAGITPVLLEDGDILRLAPGRVEVVDTAPTGRLALDAGRLLSMNGGVLAARRKMLFNGMVIGSFAVDDEGFVIGEPKVSAPGLLEPDDLESVRVREEFANALDIIPDELRNDDGAFRDAAKTALRRALGRKLQKRPLVDVHLLRV